MYTHTSIYIYIYILVAKVELLSKLRKNEINTDMSLCYVPPSGQTNDNTEFVYNNIYLFSRRTLV